MYLDFNWRQYQHDHPRTHGQSPEDTTTVWLQEGGDPSYLLAQDRNREYIREPLTTISLPQLDQYANVTQCELLKGVPTGKTLIPLPRPHDHFYSSKEEESFNVGYYLMMNPDVKVTRASEAYQHWLQYGRKEKRKTAPKPELEPYWFDSSGSRSWEAYVSGDLIWSTVTTIIQYKRKYGLKRLPRDLTLAQLEELLRWVSLFGYKIHKYRMDESHFTLMLDFNQIGGTYFYSKSLWSHFTRYPILRIVSFWSRFYLVILRGVVRPIIYDNESLLAFLRKLQPSCCFTNHHLGWDPKIIENLISMIPTSLTILHDYEWFKEPSLLQKHTYIIAQTKSIAEVYLQEQPQLRKQLLLIPHPDYRETEDSCFRTQSGRITLIGAISPKKGSQEVKIALEAGIELLILGSLDSHDFDYQLYIEKGSLIIQGYNSIAEFNQLLKVYQPRAFWFHNNLKHTMETWLYTLTLALLSGLPIIANDIPVIRERAPDAIFYSDPFNPSFFRELVTSIPQVTNIKLIKDVIWYPRFYYKLFNFDSDLYLLRNLNSIPVTMPTAQQLQTYLESQDYIPSIIEFEASSYQKTYGDLYRYKSDEELYQHWLQYGSKEGRLPNSYRGLHRDPSAPHAIISIYKTLAANKGRLLHKHEKQRNAALVFFETRKSHLFEPITRLMLKRARGRANLYVFCTPENVEFFRTALPDVEAKYIVMKDLPSQLNMNQYSHLLKEASFWNEITEEHLITYQTDSFPLRDIPWEVLLRQSYGFLGAWHYKSKYGHFDINTPKGIGMNGGFSYRRRSLLLRCIKEITDEMINNYRKEQGFHTYNGEIPEDCYYYHAMEMLGLPLPTATLCDTLFIQDKEVTSLGRLTFGYHGIFYGNIKMSDFARLLLASKCLTIP